MLLAPANPSARTAPTRPRVFDLREYAEAPALHLPGRSISYAELADLVDEWAARHLAHPTGARSLVLIEAANTLETVVAHLATLTHGHVALLVAPGRDHGELVATYRPALQVAGDEVRRLADPQDGPELHPDLAVLLSTSGSTGSPKLVRLSHDNVRSNAVAIAEALGLHADDRAITSLPPHYCYGLSVLHSHLVVGAGVVLTDLSVVDDCFWRLAREHAVTTLAGVPYTFDLLDRTAFAERRPDSLRLITQAGGAMPPPDVRRWAARGRTQGWDLVVMYGQTEATARIAVLPPELTESHAGCVGRPVPGGRLRIDAPGADGVGELVYSGPNVMLGYAETREELAWGATLEELRTGDLGRKVDGLVEIVGRRSRSAKLFGLRLDLDRIEALTGTRVVSDDALLHAFTTRPRQQEALASRLTEVTGLPRSALRVHRIEQLPRTDSGKPDRRALSEQAARAVEAEQAAEGQRSGGERGVGGVRDDFALVLGRPDVDEDDSFVSLGGDSLSYVELATRLARRAELPVDWPTRTVRDLTELADRAGRRGLSTRIDTSVLLRAFAICTIVGTHANLYTLLGGAHLLLGLAGYNLARFQLTPPGVGRWRARAASLVPVVVPSALWIGAVGLLFGTYRPATAVLLNGLLGSDHWTDDWKFWFLEALVWCALATLALLSVPAMRALEAKRPFAVAFGVTLALLALRYAWVGVQADGAPERYSVPVVAWCFTIGWAASRATDRRQRIAVTLLTCVAYAGFFGDLDRELLIVAGLTLIIWSPTLRVPRVVVPLLSVLASASLFIYLTHFEIYPYWEDTHPLFATVISLAAGCLVWWATRPTMRRLSLLARG